MDESSNVDHMSVKGYCGPTRETAHTILTRVIESFRRRADQYAALLKAIGPVENGSPAEEALWAILQNQHGHVPPWC